MTIAEYTYRELQDEVLEHQFSPTKYRPLVAKWLNQAQRRMVLESELRTQIESTTFETVAGSTQLGPTPTNFYRIVDLYSDERDQLLTPLDLKTLDAQVAGTGRPAAYAYQGSQIYVYPTPDAAYQLSMRYWRLPNDMVNDTDTPEVPAHYQELLTAYVLRKAYLRENDYQSAQVWETAWEKGMMKLRGEVVEETFDGPRQVPGAWGEESTVQPNVWVR